MSEDPDGISRRENHRAERGGDPGGEASSESRQGETLWATWETLLLNAGCDGRVIAHAKAVTALALSFTGSPLVDRDLVLAGAMLHDIGRSTTHGISHAQQGAAIARSYGLDPAIVSIIERHIGAGLTADECTLAGLIPKDCVPVTLAEKIVANADNLVHGHHAGTIERTLWGAFRLKKRSRRRIYRLWLGMEGFR
jgi:uncharacterized protein